MSDTASAAPAPAPAPAPSAAPAAPSAKHPRPPKQRSVQCKQYLVSPFSPIWPVLPEGGEAAVRAALALWNGARAPSLVVGVNEVTKRLEKGQACKLVFLCRSAEPPMLTRHVLQLAGLRGVPVCAFNGLGTLLSQLLGIRRVAAMALFEEGAPPAGDASADALRVLAETVTGTLPAVPASTRKRRASSSATDAGDEPGGAESQGAAEAGATPLVAASVRRVPLPPRKKAKKTDKPSATTTPAAKKIAAGAEKV